jgi:hypothetical protein
MIVMTGKCSECNDDKEKRLAKRKPPLCPYHYVYAQKKKQQDKARLNPKPKKALSYKREPTGELPLFKELWKIRPHESYINKEKLNLFSVTLFAHVLPKAKNRYPHFKLKEENIVFLTYDQHFKWDNGLREELKNDSEWDKMFELEEKLINEYKLLYGR